jgi:hypothetical protein
MDATAAFYRSPNLVGQGLEPAQGAQPNFLSGLYPARKKEQYRAN